MVEQSESVGDCDFCGSEEASVIPCDRLTQAFHNLLSMYIVADTYENGEPLLGLIQWHWEVFADEPGEKRQAALLEEITNSDWDDDDGEPLLDANELYMPSSNQWSHQTHSETWEEFCFDVRDNPETLIPFDDFIAEELAESQETIPLGRAVFRARAGFTLDENKERLPWSGSEIGAPPQSNAKAGRANADGEVVLYAADQEKTAVSEIRPARGFFVSVAELTVKRDCRILDLTVELPDLNPFVTETVAWRVEMHGLLNSFGEEMSRPLERADDARLYMPCQRLADYGRRNGYDGIRYPSSLNPGGSNIVFFDPNVAEAAGSKLIKITEVSFEYETDEEPRMADRLRAIGVAT